MNYSFSIFYFTSFNCLYAVFKLSRTSGSICTNTVANKTPPPTHNTPPITFSRHRFLFPWTFNLLRISDGANPVINFKSPNRINTAIFDPISSISSIFRLYDFSGITSRLNTFQSYIFVNVLLDIYSLLSVILIEIYLLFTIAYNNKSRI